MFIAIRAVRYLIDSKDLISRTVLSCNPSLDQLKTTSQLTLAVATTKKATAK